MDSRSSRQWKKLRASWGVAIATSAVSCARCGNRITSDQPWDLGHKTAVRAGGSDDDVHPEHRACNRAGDAVPAARLTAGQEWQGAGQGVTAGGRIVRDYPGGVRPATGSRYPGPSQDW